MKQDISVVIPAYNSAATLPAAIESVRKQNWPELEIIVVDDGSMDETTAVLRGLAAGDLKVLRQSNQGPAAARNRGIQAARGTWVAFLDADDLWLPAKLQMQMTALENDPEYTFCYGNTLHRDKSGGDRIEKPRGGGDQVFLYMLFAPQFPPSGVIVLRECFKRVGLFDVSLRTGEDWDLWLRLTALFKGCYVPETLIIYNFSNYRGKYPLELLERCSLTIINRLFAHAEIPVLWPGVAAQRRRLYAWHYAVLAKSYLQGHRISEFCRMAMASLWSHPVGFHYLRRRWRKDGNLPDIRPFGKRISGS